MTKNIFIFLAMMLTASASSLLAQDHVYPIGSNIDSRYIVSDTMITFGATLTIERRLTNNESYPVSGVYLTENLPVVFDIIDQTATIDGSPVEVLTEGPILSSTISGFNSYRWMIDSPEPAENLSRPLAPGEELVVRYQVVSRDIGNFGLPLHTAVMYGNGNGIFATSTGDSVRIIISLDVDDPDDNLPLPDAFHVVTAYPNPFNSEVSIYYSGSGLAHSPLRLEFYNTAGRLVSSRAIQAESDQGNIQWSPQPGVASGMYFYRLSSTSATAAGKVVLIK